MAARTGAAFSPSVTWAGIASVGLQLVGQGYRFRCQPKATYRVTVGWWELRPDVLLEPDVRTGRPDNNII
jgi:hypothetical protein